MSRMGSETQSALASLSALAPKCRWAQESEALMQSTTVNRTALWIGLLLMNAMVLAVARPVNILGMLVMNVTAITITVVALRLRQKQLSQ